MTLSPIRITGGPAGGSYPPAGLIAEYEPPSGTRWMLTSADGDRHRNIFVLPDGLKGLRGRVEWSETESVNQYGVRRSGPRNFRTPPLDISLTLGLRAKRGEMESLLRRWDRAWSFSEPGKLHVRSAAGGAFWAPADDPVLPDWPDNLISRTYLEVGMSCRVLQGHWFGRETRYGPGTFEVRAKGDAPLVSACRLIWDGRATTFQLPGGPVVSLTSVVGTRHINLDRGMSGQVTHLNGMVDSVTWSRLMGQVHGVSLLPGSTSSWVLGPGLTLEVTPRYLSPWR